MSNDPMTDDDLPATRGDLRRLEAATRDDLRRLETATRDDLRRLESRLEANLEAKLETKLDTKLAAVERRLSAELAQHANAIIEAHRSDMRAMLDPYVTLPARVEKLEAAVFAPKAKARRRSGR